MAAIKALVKRMTTSRNDHTKHEHFTYLVNDKGEEMSMYMRHNPEEALFQTMEIAQFLGVPCDPLVIDGQEVKLSSLYLMMLEKDQ